MTIESFNLADLMMKCIYRSENIIVWKIKMVIHGMSMEFVGISNIPTIVQNAYNFNLSLGSAQGF